MGSQIAKIRSIIVHTVDYNGVGVLRGHGRIPRTIILTQVAHNLVSLAAVFWMSRNAPGCKRDYSHNALAHYVYIRLPVDSDFLFFCTISRGYYKTYHTIKYINHQR